MAVTAPASKEPQADSQPRMPGWFIGALWITLGLLLITLIVTMALLIPKINPWSNESPIDEQLKNLWGFIGVAIGALVTLIGTLLTDQHNRRTSAIARESESRAKLAQEHQEKLDALSEQRLSLDTVTKLLELITEGDGYAPKARVAGAIATMVELRGGTVAVRLLGELWAADKVDTDTAIWLVNRVLSDEGTSDAEAIASTDIIARNAHKLFPHEDTGYWPEIAIDKWPSSLPGDARDGLRVAALRALLSKPPDYWRDAYAYPVATLWQALDDPDYGQGAARILLELHEAGVLEAFSGFAPSEDDEQRLRSLADDWDELEPVPWFLRLVLQIKPWARRQDPVEAIPATSPQVIVD